MHVPDQQRQNYSLDQKVELPARKLKLQWVYPSKWENETETVNNPAKEEQASVLSYKNTECSFSLILSSLNHLDP